MTAYFIYKRNEGLTPVLYAVTDSKDLNKEFMQVRNKDIFISLEKDIEKSEYKRFISAHGGYVLGLRRFATSSKRNKNSLGISRSVSIVTTASEEMNSFTHLDDVYRLMSKYVSPFSVTFNKELLTSLYNLGYYNIYKFINESESFVAGIECYNSFSGDFEFPLKYDHFQVFLYMYGWSFKKEN